MKMIDYQVLFNVAVGAAGLFGGWFVKSIIDGLKELKSDVKLVEREMRVDFVRKDDFREAIGELKDMLDKIFDRLNAKADK